MCITCRPQSHICGRNVVPRSELGELFTSLVGGGWSPAGVVYQGAVVCCLGFLVGYGGLMNACVIS